MKRRAFILLLVLPMVFSGCATGNRKLIRLEVRKSLKKELKRLKKELKRDILYELRGELPTSQARKREQLNKKSSPLQTEKIKKKTAPQLERLQTGQHPQAVQPPTQTVGNAEGRILRSGAGLPRCRVKLIRMTSIQSLGNLFNTFKNGIEFETVTDRNGNYRFEALPVGNYKIKWELPNDKGWIRRLKDRPDVAIKEGKTSTLKPIETYKTLLPR